MFIAARLIGHTLWLGALMDEPVFREGAPPRIARQIEILKGFLKR
jgi:hypothetical protein